MNMGDRIHPNSTWERRGGKALSEFLMKVACEEARRLHLIDGCVVTAFALCLGRVLGSVSRRWGHHLGRYISFNVAYVTEVAKREFQRPADTIQ